jgi:hypothetical protein
MEQGKIATRYTSPPNFLVKGSTAHLEWESAGEKVVDITNHEVLKWIRDRIAERES